MGKDKKVEKIVEMVKILNEALLEANKTLRENGLPEVTRSVRHLQNKQ